MNFPLPEKPPTFINEAIGAGIRKVITAAGAVLVYKYGFSQEMVGPYAEQVFGVASGAATIGISFLWSLLNKKKLLAAK